MKTYLTHRKMERIRDRIHRLYPENLERTMERLNMMLGRYGVGMEDTRRVGGWDAGDIVLITYADMLRARDDSPMAALSRFAVEHLTDRIRTIHLLPFYPYSSDDGFSVVDYRAVDPQVGSWREVEHLGRHFDLMLDLVLNHCSVSSEWFRQFVDGVLPGRRYFLETDPSTDLTQVTRPRTSPLLTRVDTRLGERYVWTTFSADQVDLDWSNPDVFFEMFDIMLLYIHRGARILRLDAVGFLWKRHGTTCLHLPETHELIKLFHDLLEVVAPHVLLLTETNVPHPENIQYFGDGDEAHMVYQFSLPPLLLHGLWRGDATMLSRWAASLPELPAGCTFFNFTASHDGVGLRPLQGILGDEEMAFMVQEVEKRRGKASFRTAPDGSTSPYELNISYFSALAEVGNLGSPIGLDRFFCSQLAALAMRGVPAVYFHSLVGTPNDVMGVQQTGVARAINRRKYKEEELAKILNHPDSYQRRIFHRYREILQRRRLQPAFHPDGDQEVVDAGGRLFAIRRLAPDRSQGLLCLHNFRAHRIQVSLESLGMDCASPPRLIDRLTDKEVPIHQRRLILGPYRVLWLEIPG